MEYAFKDIFRMGYNKAVLTGTDIPEMNEGTAKKAFMLLENKDAVIGPAKDGGYYLIGFNKKTFFPGVFKGIKWSTSKVFVQTLNILRINHYKTGKTKKKTDLDTFHDLKSTLTKKRNNH